MDRITWDKIITGKTISGEQIALNCLRMPDGSLKYYDTVGDALNALAERDKKTY